MLRVLAYNIDITSHLSYWEIETPNSNNENNKSKVETKIELEDKINQEVLICQIDKISS